MQKSLGFIFLLAGILFLMSSAVADDACNHVVQIPPPYEDKAVSGSLGNAYSQKVSCDNFSAYYSDAIFYEVSLTPGSNFTVSSCGTDSDTSTYLAIFQGSNCSSAVCVEQGQHTCFPHQTLTIEPTASIYYILVTASGFNAAFELVLNEMLPEGPVSGCNTPQAIEGPYDPTVTVTGTITSSSVTETPCGILDDCEGLWYTIEPQYGALVIVTTCGDYTQKLDTVVSVLEGSSCDSAECVVTNDDECDVSRNLSTATFTASSEQYYLYVSVFGACNGTFELSISETNKFSVTSTPLPSPSVSARISSTPSLTPSRSVTSAPSASQQPFGYSCGSKAQKITESGSFFLSTASDALYTSTCSGSTNQSPAYWVQLQVPIGSQVTLSTCSGETQFDTQIGIIESCKSSECVAFNDDDVNCPVASASYIGIITNQATYYAFVTGYGDASGEFELIITVQ